MGLSIDDRFAIQDLLFQYARAVDLRDAESFADCFVDGQVWITGPGFEVRDAKQNMDTMRAAFEWTMHKVHNHAYTRQDQQATGYCYCVASHIKSQQGQRLKVDWHICYRDELLHDGSRWRFRKRHLEVGMIETLPLQS